MRPHDEFRERTSPASRDPKPTIRRVISTAVALFCAVILGLLGTGGTYAYLNAQTTVSAGTITAGSMNLQVGDLTWSGANRNALLPGQSAYASFQLQNVGDVPASVSGVVGTTSGALPDGLVFMLAPNQCDAAAMTFAPLSSKVNFQKGEGSPMCLRIQLAEDAPQHQQVKANFVVTLNSVQRVS